MAKHFNIHEPDKTWFISDTHFGHDNVLKFEPGFHNFRNIHEHDETIISNWQKAVKPEDTVFFLGDASMPKVKLHYVLQCFSRLPGKIVWFWGNHDMHVDQEWQRQITSVADVRFTMYEEIHVPDDEKTNHSYDGRTLRQIVLFHYPIYDWHGMYQDAYHLYGHSHQNLHPMRNSYSVCACYTNYTPVNFKWVKEKIKHHNARLD